MPLDKIFPFSSLCSNWAKGINTFMVKRENNQMEGKE
jgi:hypothetical protein